MGIRRILFGGRINPFGFGGVGEEENLIDHNANIFITHTGATLITDQNLMGIKDHRENIFISHLGDNIYIAK